MQRVFQILAALLLVLMLSPAALATNGTNLIAIGPVARAMGGVGIASPQSAISAVFSNPAAMCFGPYCPASESNFAGTLFMPRIDASVTVGDQETKADADDKYYVIPAFGVSLPITKKPPFWRFGLAAFGVTGLGVDYRDTALDGANFGGTGLPLASGEYTQLQILKFAPAIAFQPFERVSFGLAAQVGYSTLDLRNGSSAGYGIGAQMGMIYRITDNLSFGLTYVSPMNIDHRNVIDFESDGSDDDLELESPQMVGAGLAYTFLENRLLVEGDVKWLNWADSNGYEEFDWNNQWVFAIGAQYKPISKLALRLGYNYGKSPVDEHDDFNGDGLTSVQGHQLPTYYYETFRIIGLPAIVEHHLTAGIGYEFSPSFGLHLGYMHAFKKTIKEHGTFAGEDVEIKSSLYEDSLDFALTWRF